MQFCMSVIDQFIGLPRIRPLFWLFIRIITCSCGRHTIYSSVIEFFIKRNNSRTSEENIHHSSQNLSWLKLADTPMESIVCTAVGTGFHCNFLPLKTIQKLNFLELYASRSHWPWLIEPTVFNIIWSREHFSCMYHYRSPHFVKSCSEIIWSNMLLRPNDWCLEAKIWHLGLNLMNNWSLDRLPFPKKLRK